MEGHGKGLLLVVITWVPKDPRHCL